jgi:hypothetical protein
MKGARCREYQTGRGIRSGTAPNDQITERSPSTRTQSAESLAVRPPRKADSQPDVEQTRARVVRRSTRLEGSMPAPSGSANDSFSARPAWHEPRGCLQYDDDAAGGALQRHASYAAEEMLGEPRSLLVAHYEPGSLEVPAPGVPGATGSARNADLAPTGSPAPVRRVGTWSASKIRR